MDNTRIVKALVDEDKKKDDVVFIIPEEVEIDPELTFPTYKWGLNSIHEIMDKAQYPVVLHMPADVTDMVEKYFDICGVYIKVLQGGKGEYPAHWLVTTGRFAHIDQEDIIKELLAEKNDNKPPKIASTNVVDQKREFHLPDEKQFTRQENVADEAWDEQLAE